MSTKQPFFQLADDDRCLRGGCHCGRNRYIIDIPNDARETAQVLFKTDPAHQISLATPLPAFLRVPLAWYRSSTHAVFDDETASMIYRVYSPASPSQECAQRRFCGFCGTPLTYWCENPLSEADFILVTLGSLHSEDLRDLDDLGLVPDSDESDDESVTSDRKSTSSLTKEPTGVPWLDAMMQGTPLSKMRQTQARVVGEETTRGSIRVEWEITEWTDDASSVAESHGDDSDIEGMEWTTHTHGKRKLQDFEDTGAAV